MKQSANSNDRLLRSPEGMPLAEDSLAMTFERKNMAQITKQELEEKIIQTLKSCYDPEIPVDIFELGLIYEIAIDDDYNVKIKMTLTSPMCPVAGSLPPEVEGKVKAIPEVKDAKIELVWSPPWDKDMMSDVAKVELGFY